MKLTTRLVFIALIPLLMAAMVGGALAYSLSAVADLRQLQATVIASRNELGTLNDLARGYLLHDSQRSRLQYETLHAQAMERLGTTAGIASAYEGELRDIQRDVVLSRELFDRSVALRTQVDMDPDVAQLAEDRLASQQFLHLRNARFRAGTLATGITDEIIQTQRRIYTLLGASVLALAVALSLLLVAFWRHVAHGLVALQRGTDAVGGGDLDHRIALTRSDELGSLARSFDSMTERLRGVTASRDDLERLAEENRRLYEMEQATLERERGLLEQVEQERAQLRTVLATLPVAVFISDASGRIVYMNAEVEAIWGEPRIVASTGEYEEYRAWRPETGERLRAHDWSGAKALKGETVIGEILEIERFSGGRATILNSSAPIKDAHGEIVGQVTVEQDITRRAELERKLRQSAEAQAQLAEELRVSLEEQFALTEQLQQERAQLSAILENMEEAVGLWSPEGEQLAVNSATVRMHGFETREQMLKHLSEYRDVSIRTLDGADLPMDQWPAARVIRGESFTNEQLEVVIPSNSTRFIGSYSGVPVTDEDGNMVLGVTTIHDVTELLDARRRIEEELATSSSWLEASAALAASLDVQTVARIVAEHAAAFTNARRAIVAKYDPLTHEAYDPLTHEAVIVDAVDGGSVRAGQRLPLTAFPDGIATLMRDGVTEPAARDEYVDPSTGSEAAGEFAYRYYVAVPLVTRGRPVGVLVLDDPNERHTFTEQHTVFLEGLAAQAAVAMENARLLEEQREAAVLGEALNAVNAAANSTLEFDDIMQRVITETALAIEADSAVVYIKEPSGWVARYAHGLPVEVVGQSLTAEEVEYSMRSLRQGTAVIVNDPPSDPRADESLLSSYGVLAVMDVALTVGDEIIGDMSLHFHSPGKRFTDAHARFAEKVAASATLALRNARLYQGERHVAETLQGSLLTLPPRLEAVEFDCRYNSAAEEARVGGDFYDLFELEEGLLGITVGDVAGKGLDAAVLTSLLKNAIRAQATEPDKSPSDVLRAVNTLVLRSSAEDAFATVFFGLLDRRTGKLRYCNAGHTTVALLCSRDGGPVERIEATSPLVGAFEGVPYSDAEASLCVGDMLFMYTDGLTEARSGDGEFFGEDRLFSLLAGHLGDPPGVTVAHVLDEAIAFAGGGLTDDVAVLAVQLTAWRAPDDRSPA